MELTDDMSLLAKMGLAKPPAAAPTGDNRVIQGLWIGRQISLNGQLSIRSFLDHGHEYHLYAYDELDDVPPGTEVKDAGEIMPRDSIFQFHTGSYAMFADTFRIHLLLGHGGWWCDLDMICLRPFDLPEEIVLITEPADGYASAVLTNGIMKFPPHSPFGEKCLEFLDKVDNETNQEWVLTNRTMLEHVVPEMNGEQWVKPPEYFSPLFWGEATPTFTDERHARNGRKLLKNRKTYTLHLFNEFWRKNGVDQNARFHPKSLIEVLRARHGV